MAKQQSDSELVVRTLTGDQQAFGELVTRYRSAVFGVAFHRLGNFENARDVAQEAFLKAYASLSRLRKPESFASWLYHITDLTALEVVRRPQREVLFPIEELPASGPAKMTDEESDLAQQVREALATLDEPTRLAVVLHYIDGYSYAEVANFLGTTSGAVRTRVSRAKSQLRAEVLGMIQETFSRMQSGFSWAMNHASAKSSFVFSFWGWPEARRNEVHDLAEALLWLDPELNGATGWREQHREAARHWVDYILKALSSGEFHTVVMENIMAAGQEPASEVVYLRVSGDQSALKWMLLAHAWRPIRDRLAQLAKVHLTKGNDSGEGIIRRESANGTQFLRVIMSPRVVYMLRATGEGHGTQPFTPALDTLFEYDFAQGDQMRAGVTVAASEENLIRKIKEAGGEMVGVRSLQGENQQGTFAAPLVRVIHVILTHAASDGADTVSLACVRFDPEEKTRLGYSEDEALRVRWRTAGVWHDALLLPTYLWSPLRALFLSTAGVAMQAGKRTDTVEGKSIEPYAVDMLAEGESIELHLPQVSGKNV